jgi:hypothetical protein
VTTTIQLDRYELFNAAFTGVLRHLSSLYRGSPDAHGYNGEDGWTKHIEGAAGEVAAAKACNLFWGGSVNTFKGAGDVGIFEVRTRSRHDYELLVRPDDDDKRVFVLVTGRAPKFVVRGWMRAGDAKRDKWKHSHGGRPPAYFVPHDQLRPLEDLLVLRNLLPREQT